MESSPSSTGRNASWLKSEPCRGKMTLLQVQRVLLHKRLQCHCYSLILGANPPPPPAPPPPAPAHSHTHTHMFCSHFFLTLVYYCLNFGHQWTEFDIHVAPTYSVWDQTENQAKVMLRGPFIFIYFIFYFIVSCVKIWEGFGRMWSTGRSSLSSGWSLIGGILFCFFN